MIRRAASTRSAVRRGFTLVELLITVSIIAIMASMVLFAMFQAQDAAKAQKTRTLITKLNNIIMTRYDEYRTRRIPYQFPPPPPSSAPPADKLAYQRMIGQYRLDCLRDLMRMEMPDRWTDVVDDPIAPFPEASKITRPPISQVYLAKRNAAYAVNPLWPTDEHQGAECLYMIVMAAVAQQGDARTVFKATDIADTDGDGMPEFIDGWGNPIRFLRWAPGYPSEQQIFGGIRPTVVNPSGNTVEVQFDGARFRPNGDYVGGVLAVKENGEQNFNANRMARITGYSHTGPLATFTCEAPSAALLFPGGIPTDTEAVVFMHADPFDSRGVYPDYVNITTPTYWTSPLIYSAGSDRCFGVYSEFEPQLQYTLTRLNPCTLATDGKMIGMQENFPTEPNYRPNGWLDNITNHQLNTR